MIGFFIPIAEALFIGYFAAILIYAGLMVGVTQLGRRALMQDNCVTLTYSFLNTLCWIAAAFVGAYLCSSISPLDAYGHVGFPLVLAVVLCILAVRNFRQLPGQMSGAALLAVLVGILLGTFGALAIRHAFAALNT